MIRTRFAPSPTGYLHIGGVRTALFCWLFARRHGGQFILRIDDTDQQRNLDQTLGPILEGFRWLGIDWDEGPEVGGGQGPYFQSQRDPLYQEAVEALLAAGAAYRDYASPDELQVARVAISDAPPIAPPGVELVDLFVLHPILSPIDPPAAIAFPADTGLAPGTRVTFHALDYELGQLVPVASGEVDAEGRAVSDEGQGIPELTWVGLSVEDNS